MVREEAEAERAAEGESWPAHGSEAAEEGNGWHYWSTEDSLWEGVRDRFSSVAIDLGKRGGNSCAESKVRELELGSKQNEREIERLGGEVRQKDDLY